MSVCICASVQGFSQFRSPCGGYRGSYVRSTHWSECYSCSLPPLFILSNMLPSRSLCLKFLFAACTSSSCVQHAHVCVLSTCVHYACVSRMCEAPRCCVGCIQMLWRSPTGEVVKRCVSRLLPGVCSFNKPAHWLCSTPLAPICDAFSEPREAGARGHQRLRRRSDSFALPCALGRSAFRRKPPIRRSLLSSLCWCVHTAQCSRA